MPRILLGALLFAFSIPSTVRAYEDEVVLEVGAGYVGSFGVDARHAGLRADVGVLVGVSPALSLGFRAEGGVFFDDGGCGYVSPVAELVYAIDVVRTVPRFGLGVRGIVATEREGLVADLGIDVVLGVDFLPRSGPNYGLELRATFVPLDRVPSLGPIWLGLALRIGLGFER